MSLKSTLISTLSNLHMKVDQLPATASYTTNGLVFTWGAMTFNQVLALIGAVLALLTFVVNTYYQRRRDRREADLHDQRMRNEREARAHNENA